MKEIYLILIINILFCVNGSILKTFSKLESYIMSHILNWFLLTDQTEYTIPSSG